MIDWVKRKPSRQTSQFTRAFSQYGILIANSGVLLADGEAAIKLTESDVGALVHQLEDEGFALPGANGWVIPWELLYNLMDHNDYAASLILLQIPAVRSYSATLRSDNSLTDENFSILLSDWRDEDGKRIGTFQLTGAVVRQETDIAILPRETWRLVERIVAFSARDESKRTPDFHRREWSEIRKIAIAANAGLDNFLFQTVILTPDRLEIELTKTEVGGTKVIEIAPTFDGAPKQWLGAFDAFHDVKNRYDITTADGIIQILILPEVKTVLQQIKRLPGRRVAGSRAEAFIINPFAALGEDAGRVLDPDQFERAREDAGLLFEHFTTHVERDNTGYPIQVGLLIEGANSQGPSKSELHLFSTDEELHSFSRLVRTRLAEGMQLCAWQGYDFELLGDTVTQVDLLDAIYTERLKPRMLVSYAATYDLSRYTGRIDQIGVEKPYYSPFIAKKVDDQGWVPDNVIPVITWTPKDGKDPIAVPFTKELEDLIKSKIGEAKVAKQDEITLKGFDKPLSVSEAQSILETFKSAFEDITRNNYDPQRQASKDENRSERKGLIIRANIRSIDYEEARRDILTALPGQPVLPMALKREVRLKEHQRSGVAWLQYLFSRSPTYCRGVVLADDMGLGKTLQLLTLIFASFEEQPGLDPALVVAPVSLLENWKEEIEQFFQIDSGTVLTAYGSELANLRVPRASIDEQLLSEGLVRFLKPGWRGKAKIVLTTYETLRDLEFSFAAEHWSIMVCDEAQKIKNPNALVSRAAKKQKVQFKIACTGTPVENTLADLWCLFDFVQPGLLGALNEFGQRYRKPIEAETDEEKDRVEELRMKISPQILRRTKKEVAKELKEKIVVDDCSHLAMSPHQRMLYGQAIELFKQRNNPGSITPFKNHLSLLHYLRLICVDPRRYGLNEFRPDPIPEYRVRAPKLDWLLLKLQEIRKRGEKAIIFCEFRAIQRLLRHYIEETFEYAADIINGDTTATASHSASRQKRIKAFQEKSGFGVIILSPLAVGFGVNIQAANHVIHYTRTWNPAKEDQATDRAYRIGQLKNVYVYYPIVRADDFDTFDVKLDRLLTRKRELADDMLNGAGDIAPGDFDIGDMMPGGSESQPEPKLVLDDILRMRHDYFECFVAALWQRRGFQKVYRTPDSGDDGVDVVAMGSNDELIQCKSSTVDHAKLGWDAIKDVVTGEASYRERYPGARFRKVCVTNQFFNENAYRHAEYNDVELYDQKALAKLIETHPITMLDVERLLFTDWNQPTTH